MPSNPFLKLRSTPNFAKGHLLQWWLNPGFTGRAPYRFVVDVFQDENQKEAIYTKDIGENYFFIDDKKLIQNFVEPHTYRVTLTTADNEKYTSELIDLGVTGISRHKYLNASEMVRKEFVRLRYVGQSAWLLKRKNYSAAAVGETDPVTGEAIIDTSSGSYGTGLVGGYYDPVFFRFTMEAMDTSMDYHQEGRGATYTEALKLRTVAYPYISQHDIMVTREGKRYMIDSQDEIHYPGTFFAIVQNCECHLIANTDTIYSIPVPSFTEIDDI